MSFLCFRIQSRILYCIIFFLLNLQSLTIPKSFLYFHDFDSFEEYGLVSCLVDYHSNWLSYFFFHDYIKGIHFGQECHRRGALLSASHQGQIGYVLLLVADAHLGHLDEVVSANVFHCEVTIFLFVINRYLWVGRYFVMMNYPSSLQTLPMN